MSSIIRARRHGASSGESLTCLSLFLVLDPRCRPRPRGRAAKGRLEYEVIEMKKTEKHRNFEQLVGSFTGLIKAVARKYIDDKFAVDDVAQLALINAWR